MSSSLLEFFASRHHWFRWIVGYACLYTMDKPSCTRGRRFGLHETLLSSFPRLCAQLRMLHPHERIHRSASSAPRASTSILPSRLHLDSSSRVPLALSFPSFPSQLLCNSGSPTSTPFLPIEIFGRSHRDLWGWDRYESGGRIDTNGDVWRRRVDESVGDVRRWRRWSASWTA